MTIKLVEPFHRIGKHLQPYMRMTTTMCNSNALLALVLITIVIQIAVPGCRTTVSERLEKTAAIRYAPEDVQSKKWKRMSDEFRAVFEQEVTIEGVIDSIKPSGSELLVSMSNNDSIAISQYISKAVNKKETDWDICIDLRSYRIQVGDEEYDSLKMSKHIESLYKQHGWGKGNERFELFASKQVKCEMMAFAFSYDGSVDFTKSEFPGWRDRSNQLRVFKKLMWTDDGNALHRFKKGDTVRVTGACVLDFGQIGSAGIEKIDSTKGIDSIVLEIHPVTRIDSAQRRSK